MEKEEIIAADLIFKYSSTQHSTLWQEVNQAMRDMKHDLSNVDNAKLFLLSDGYLEYLHGEIRLTPKGLEFQRSGRSYGGILADIQKKKKAQEEKEKRDNYHKMLEIEKLEAERMERTKKTFLPIPTPEVMEALMRMAERSKEVERLKKWAMVWFLLALILILIPLNWYFLKTSIDWKNSVIYDPFSWIDKEQFGRGELVITVLWIGFDSFIFANCRNWWKMFSEWYCEKFNTI